MQTQVQLEILVF